MVMTKQLTRQDHPFQPQPMSLHSSKKKKRSSQGDGHGSGKSAEIVDATLGTGPLGITLQKNSCGPDISAVVQEVNGAAAATGKIKAGQFIQIVDVQGRERTRDYS